MQRGFTLIEIVIVVAILAAILGLALPRIRRTDNNIKSVMRELSVLTVEVRHYARLKNATYRIVFNMNGQEDSYYVEAGSTAVLIKSEAKQKQEAEAEQSLDKDKKPVSAFHRVDKPLKDEKKLPHGLFIKSVENKSISTPVTKGNGYIFFTPEGLVDETVIQISDGKNLTWSLIINPLTGHADMVDKAITLKDMEVE